MKLHPTSGIWQPINSGANALHQQRATAEMPGATLPSFNAPLFGLQAFLDSTRWSVLFAETTSGLTLDTALALPDWLRPRTDLDRHVEKPSPMSSPLARGSAASPLRLLARTLSPSATVLVIVATALVPGAVGHDHHEDKIEEGQTVSADPIVRIPARPEASGNQESQT